MKGNKEHFLYSQILQKVKISNFLAFTPPYEVEHHQ